MRLNKFVALATGRSRRQADELIDAGRVRVNGRPARLGQQVAKTDIVELDGKSLQAAEFVYLLLRKPTGYVCSRQGQGAPTIFELLPENLRQLKCVGRLDKDTSGALLMTNDGDWAQQLTHPSFNQIKHYQLELDKPLKEPDKQRLLSGVELEDGLSKFDSVAGEDENRIEVILHGGRNRQIRRSLAALGYNIKKLHRTQFGPYRLNGLKSGEFKEVSKADG